MQYWRNYKVLGKLSFSDWKLNRFRKRNIDFNRLYFGGKYGVKLMINLKQANKFFNPHTTKWLFLSF